jgi:hypothetical protein
MSLQTNLKQWRMIYYLEVAIFLAVYALCFINNHKWLALFVVMPAGWILSAFLWRKKTSK